MSYSIDLRERVIGFIENGGSKIAASRFFSSELSYGFSVSSTKERALKFKY